MASTVLDLGTRSMQMNRRRRGVGGLAASLIVIVVIGVSPASARGIAGGAGSSHSLSTMSHSGRMSGAHHSHFVARVHFGHFHDFPMHHHHHRGELSGWLWPWGYYDDFGWGLPQYHPADTIAEESDGGRMPLARRYEPPTVEASPSGVSIMRGPGSRHF
jgi:hypothetical protein